MWPLVAISAATALAQLYQSEKARGANAAKLKQMEAEFAKLVPPNAAIRITDLPAQIKDKIGEPSYDMSAITPEQYKVIAQYKPEVAPMILEQRPELIKDSAEGKAGREAQMAALQKLRDVSKGGVDPEMAAKIQAANRQSDIQAQSRSQSVLQDAQRRGGLNSGTALAATLQGQSDAGERAAMQSQGAAVESYRNQLQALRDSAQLGGNIQQSDRQMSGNNADIINAFNQRTSTAMRDYNNQRADIQNRAQMYNQGQAQGVADQNTTQNNKYAVMNRDHSNDMMSKIYQQKMQERDYQKGLQGMVDNNAQNKFGNQLNILKGKNGLMGDAINQTTQQAQDRNSAIQGLGNAAASGYQYNNQQKQYEDSQDRADRRAAMYGSGNQPSERQLFFEKYGRFPSDQELKNG